MENKWKLPCYIAFYPRHLITGTKANLTRRLRITDGRSKDATLLRGASAENEGIQEIPATTIGGFPKLGVPFRGAPVIRIKGCGVEVYRCVLGYFKASHVHVSILRTRK